MKRSSSSLISAGVTLRAASVLALFFTAAPVAAQYDVKIEPGTRHLVLQLTFSADAEHPTRLATRGKAWGLREQVEDVKCGNVALGRDPDGDWLATPGCSRISWKVTADTVPDDGIDLSKQRTLAVGQAPWFLLPEATSLLRPLGLSGSSSIGDSSSSDHLLGATPVGPGRFRVPPANNAPEFYVLGPVAPVERVIGDFHVIYIADDQARVERLGLDRLHAKVLSYLLGIVPLPKPGEEFSRRLLVIWVRVGKPQGRIGGAAGSRSFVANYLIGPPADERSNVAMTLAIMAHEQFHQLVDMLRGQLTPLPVWLSESLAQYYGLKALLSAQDSKSARALRNEFIDPSRSVPVGLLELNRRYGSGDRAEYDRFYSQGATLWNAVDSAIVTATAGRQSLDDYVKDLLRSPISEEGTLPKGFIEQLRRVLGPEIDRIIAKYIGR